MRRDQPGFEQRNQRIVISSSSPTAPIALFAYKRPAHLQRTLEALQRDPLFARSAVHIYCDGPRYGHDVEAIAQTREIARRFATPLTRLVFRDRNHGLRESIVQGVTELTAAHDRVIVIEDDLVVGDQFLTFMNAALDRYAYSDAVYQVSGHMFPVAVPSGGTPLLLPFTTTWGWATWKRAWRHFDPLAIGYRQLLDDSLLRKQFDLGGSYPYFRMLQKQQAGEVDSWGILWYLSVFLRQGLTVFPRQSLVANEGFDGSGTNCSTSSGEASQKIGWPTMQCQSMPAETIVDHEAFDLIRRHLAESSSIRSRLLRRTSGYLARIRL